MFIVEMQIVNSWENVWRVDNELQTFETYNEAQTEINEFIKECNEEQLDYDKKDFRITEI